MLSVPLGPKGQAVWGTHLSREVEGKGRKEGNIKGLKVKINRWLKIWNLRNPYFSKLETKWLAPFWLKFSRSIFLPPPHTCGKIACASAVALRVHGGSGVHTVS